MSQDPERARPLLVVVDDEAERHRIAVGLTHAGYAVTSVDRLATARAEVERARTPFAAVVCALPPPAPYALGLVEDLAALCPDGPLLALCGFGGEELVIEAMRRGAADVLGRPCREADLRLCLRKAELRDAFRDGARPRDRVPRGANDRPQIVYAPGRGSPMEALLGQVARVAPFRTTVLLAGESGTGKELVARALHAGSPRAAGPFVAVNCGAISDQLVESELFGHKRGAFTDAIRDKPGLFDEAHGGTLFLDEIGELPLAAQVKLLRALQEDVVRPVGGSADHPVDVRILAASVRDLEAEVREGRFREDLYYRLNVVRLHLPPLRERAMDLEALVDHFVARFNARLGTRFVGVSPPAMARLRAHPWPGNVRELENTLERAVVLAEGDLIDEASLGERFGGEHPAAPPRLPPGELSIKKTVRALEEELIRAALAKTHGHRANASKLLEISPSALLYKIKEYGLDREE